jgi:transposase
MQDAAASVDPSLPQDIAGLQQMVRQLLAEVARLRQENQQLRDRLDLALRQQFGRRSERQRLRVRPVEVSAEPAPDSGHGRQVLPNHLPRQAVVHDLTEAEKLCPACGRPRTCIGEQTSEQLDYQPAHYFVVRHIKKSYACRHGDCAGTAEQRLQTAGPAVVGPIPKGLPGAGLLAHLITCKYADHLPLYRLEHIVARSGVRLARSTLCDWMKAAADLLAPLVALLQARIVQSRVIHSDDTPVPFQVPDEEKTKTGHLWVYIGDAQHSYTLFDFTTHYSRAGPEGILQGYSGYLQADALAQYEGLYATGQVKHVACWAHVRRKLVEAQRSDPARADAALAFIGRLYAVEKDLPAKTGSAENEALRQQQRQMQATPILAELHSWLESHSSQVTPKSPLGAAIRYALKNWEALQRYLEQGYLAIDNNLAERTLRQVAIGRKNWLFCGSAEGGKTAAVLYSVVGTCKHLGVDPFAYLRDTLAGLYALGEAPAAEKLMKWLPDRWLLRRTGGASCDRELAG